MGWDIANFAALEGRADFEIVYVDDGSTDATPQRLAEAQKLHPRLRVLAHAESCGQSATLDGDRD